MRVAFLQPVKLSDHFFVEQHEVAIATTLTAAGHPAEVVDFLFEPDRDETDQLEELRARLTGRYDLIFLRHAWSSELARVVASTTTHLVGWQNRDLLTQGLADVAVFHVSRATAMALVEALATGAPLAQVPGLTLRVGEQIRDNDAGERHGTYDELASGPIDASRRVTLSARGPNPHRAVVVSNTGCAYRNIPNRTATFEGVTLPQGVKTSGCTFCSVSAYEKMTEEQAIEVLVKQIDAELRHRPHLTEIAIKDDFALRFLGKLSRALRAWSAESGISLGHRTVLLSARPDYLLTFRDAIEEALGEGEGAFPAALGFYLLGYENFSDAELTRFHKGMTGAEIERALERMDDWAARYPARFRLSPTSGFILFTPWTRLEDLRINAEVMRRRGFSRFRGRALLSQLRLHPEQPLYWLAEKDGLLETVREDPSTSDAYRRGYRMDAPWRFADPKVAAVHAAVLAAASLPDDALFEVFEEALDAAAGQARGKNKRPLRMVRAPNDKQSGGARTQQINVVSACNQSCGFCTYRASPAQALDERQRHEAIAARAADEIRAAAAAGTARIVLSGAEPFLSPHVFSLARLAKNHGVGEVEIETNGTILGAALLDRPDKGRAAIDALLASGVTRARVALNAVTAERSDAITGESGGLLRTVAAIDALRAAGITVELAVALVPATAGELPRLVAWAAARNADASLPPLTITARWIAAPRPGYAASSPEEARAELLAGWAAAERLGVTLRAAPGSELPPCAYPEPAAVPGLVRLHPSLVEREERAPAHERRHQRVAACEGCAARTVCPGPLASLASLLSPLLHTLDADALGERAVRSTVRERQLREFKSELTSAGVAGEHQRRILRLVFHCNQSCDFCFVSRELPPIEHERLVAEIEDCGAKGIAIDFSGGEPTLHPQVLDYIRLAKSKGAPRVELQTNAIKMADRAFAGALREAGLSSAFVSLHGTTAAVSDRVTAAPGTFVRTVAGIGNLLAEGVPVQLNFVVCGQNHHELAGYPDFVHATFIAPLAAQGRRAEVGITLSYAAASTDNVPRDGRLIPRISTVAPSFEEAIARAAHHGIPVDGLDTKCGVPACYLPRAVREVAFAHAVPAGERARAAAGFTRAPACERCDYGDRCFGIRSSYAELHGLAELRAIRGGEVVTHVEGHGEAADHPIAGDAFDRIGLAHGHRLRPGSRERLSAADFPAQGPTLIAEAPDAAARERVQLDVGLRSLLKLERSDVISAEAAAELERAQGYHARVFSGAPGPGGYPRAIAFAAKDPAVLDVAVAIEEGLTRDRTSRAEGVRAMGALLGYPPCCAAAFAEHPQQNDATWIARLARQHAVDEGGRSLSPSSNWASPELRLFSHFPCSTRCAATLALAEQTMRALSERAPKYAHVLGRALRSVGLALTSDRYVLLEEPEGAQGITEPGASYAYGRVWSHFRIGMATSRHEMPEYRAFELEVVEALASGDHVLRTPHALVVSKGGQLVREIVFAGDAPRLLDFRGRRALPRLTVLAT